MDYSIKPVGIIHSPYKTKEECPIQGVAQPDVKGTIELFSEYSEGLRDVETFSHIILIYLFDRAGEVKLVRKPFLDDTPHGVFASRHPCRPNGIGLSVVRLLKREANILNVSGIDTLDKTPLIDIKPYIPIFDVFPEANSGWVSSKDLRPKPIGRE